MGKKLKTVSNGPRGYAALKNPKTILKFPEGTRSGSRSGPDRNLKVRDLSTRFHESGDDLRAQKRAAATSDLVSYKVHRHCRHTRTLSSVLAVSRHNPT